MSARASGRTRGSARRRGWGSCCASCAGWPGGASPASLGGRSWKGGMDERAAMLVPKALLDGVIEQFRPVRVILFGSRARGDARPDSDIDLLVVVDDDLLGERRDWRAVNEARRNYDGAVDILPWRRSSYDAQRGVIGSLPWTADREGITVYGPEMQPLSDAPADARSAVAGQWLARADEDLRITQVCALGASRGRQRGLPLSAVRREAH